MFIDETQKSYLVIPDGVINIQNVVDYEYNNSIRSEYFFSDTFSFKLPFTFTWFEFKIPTTFYYNKTEIILPYRLGNRKYGVFASESKIPYPNVTFKIYKETKIGPYEFITLVLPINEETGKYNNENEFNFYIDPEFCKKMEKDGFSKEQTTKASEIMFGIALMPVCLFLNFYHCKNVKLQCISLPEKVIKKRLKNKDKKDFFQKYYTISIEPMKKVLESYGSKESGINHAFHIVPGHFKEYKKGEDGTGGLFGKHVGVWFWNNHVRGDKKIGEIHKDYDVDLKSLDESKIKSRI